MPELRWSAKDGDSGATQARKGQAPGPVVRSRRAERPIELDVRTSMLEAVARTGETKLRLHDLYEKVREPLVVHRFLRGLFDDP